MTEELFWLRLRREGKELSRAKEARFYGDPAKHIRFKSEKGEAMRRVRKEEVKFDSWVKPDPLDVCLSYWGIWMGKADIDVGMQIGSDNLVGCGNPHQRRETEIAEAMDAMISGLKTHERWAINKRCGVATAWRFPNMDFADALSQAEQSLIEKMKKNIATRSLF